MPTVTETRRILVVDDEAHIREVIQYALEREGFAVELAADGAQALELQRAGGPLGGPAGRGIAPPLGGTGGASASAFDLIVLDILMPELDGLSFCRRVRESSAVPIIFVSSRAEELDRVLGLELGGDDYLVKPFSPRELVARVRTVLRRAAAPRPGGGQAIAFGPLVVDPASHEATVGRERIALTATEFAILHALLSEAGRVLTRAELVRRAYQAETHVTLRTMDTHVRRIRGKLRRFGLAPITTVHGIGYRAAPRPRP